MSALAAAPHDQLARTWESAPGVLGWFGTVDHKQIGIRYLVTAFAFFIAGGTLALVMRAQLAIPENTLISAEQYDQIFSMHGTTMIFLFITPLLSGFGNYLVPLMIGARDMAFPRLNMFGYWVFVLAGLFMYASFTVGAAPIGGWFGYPPLTGPAYSRGPNMDFWTLGLLFLGMSTTAGAINFIVTILKLRAPGMTVSRMPLFVWNILITAFVMLFAIPSLTAAVGLLELDRAFGMHFFDPASGGSPILYQHLFWIFGHPDVYIIFLPAVGIVSTVIPAFSRRPIVGYPLIVMATIATGILAFGVWAHHMFAVGLSPLAISFFSAASMLISVPAGIQMVAWISTIWTGRPVLRTPMLFAIGFLVLFLLGGITGVMVALIPLDLQVTDSYFVVAHFHYVLFGASVFPVFAGLHYWWPKITGRLLDEGWGQATFWLMFAGFNVAFFPMHIAGMLGMPRRVYTYAPGLGWDLPNLIETVGAFAIALSVVLFLVNCVRSIAHGRVAGPDPWGASTLEWATTSPPPVYDFTAIPIVASRDPLWTGREELRHFDGEDVEGASTRRTLATSALDADPEVLLRMPRDSFSPLWLALSLLVFFAGLLVRLPPVWVVGALLVFVTAVAWLWPGGDTT